MAWLDRDRTPALFAVATSATSGLLTFVVANTVLVDVSKNVVLTWVAVTFVGVALVSWTAVLVVRRVRKRSLRAFLIVSAFQQKHFIASFVHEMHNALDRFGIDMVLKVPERDYDASAQARHLDQILTHKRDYLGGIVFAGEVDELRDDLDEFCQKLQRPVVFTDLEPFKSNYPGRSVYVGYRTAQLGELAGKWLVNHLRDVSCPRVLIIASREHASRQKKCRAELNELADVTIDIDDSCAFMRSRAYNSVLTYIRKLDSDQHLDAIFCTDDETGLGAVEALAAAPSPATESTVVVGIDGVADAKTLIDSGTSPFRATVVQDTQQLALRIADRLVKMHRGGKPLKQEPLEPVIYEATGGFVARTTPPGGHRGHR